jgi:hypothetical protein
LGDLSLIVAEFIKYVYLQIIPAVKFALFFCLQAGGAKFTKIEFKQTFKLLDQATAWKALNHFQKYIML